MTNEESVKMTATRRTTRGLATFCITGLVGIALTGCTTEFFQSMSAGARARYGAGQNDAIVQGNSEKISNALDRAAQQTCDAALPYKEAAREIAATSTPLVDESSAALASFQEDMAQTNFVAGLANRTVDSRDQNWGEFEDAQRVLLGYTRGSRLDRTASVQNVWNAAENQFNLLRNVSRDLWRSADELRIALDTDEGVALLEEWGDPEVDLRGMIDEIVAEADALNTTWIELQAEELDLPTDRSTLIGGMDGSSRVALEAKVNALLRARFAAARVRDRFKPVTDFFEETQKQLEQRRREQVSRTRAIADETGELAVEVTRNAWLAVEACGGEVPPEHREIVDNPFDEHQRIPTWNSTFWDISSPGGYSPPPP